MRLRRATAIGLLMAFLLIGLTFVSVNARAAECLGVWSEDLGPDETNPPPSCEGNKHLIGACYKVHGRYQYAEADGVTSIWIVGTHHVLGVAQLNPLNAAIGAIWMPEKIDALAYWKGDIFTYVYGDFLVCPLAKEEPGRMGCVCVQSASNLVTQRFKSYNDYDAQRGVYNGHNDPQGVKVIPGTWSLPEPKK
jgi:hypothetical protein